MLDRSLFRQTVTLYHWDGQAVKRTVLSGVAFQKGCSSQEQTQGQVYGKSFRLYVPGTVTMLQPGDRVMEGIGPQVESHQWSGFIPATVRDLYTVTWVKPYSLLGQAHHTEAGGD